MTSRFNSANTADNELLVSSLTTEVEEFLAERAHRNGRTVDEEAEHVIKAHLADTDCEIPERERERESNSTSADTREQSEAINCICCFVRDGS